VLTQVSAAVAPLTWARVATSWRAEPGVLAVVAALGLGYGLGLYLRGRRGVDPPWPRARTWCFGLGTLSIGLVGTSFIGVYDDTLFWVRGVQNIVLLMVAPMLLALGAPLSLARDVLSTRWRTRLSRVLRSTPARVASQPLAITLILTLPLLVLYLGPLYEMTLRSPAASGISGTVVAMAGFVYFWTRFRVDPTPRAGSYGVTLVITIVEMIGDAVLGVVLWLGPTVAAGYYAALTRDWGPSIRNDQLLGAGVLWVGGDVVGLPFIMVVLGRMRREDEANAEQIDAELDALDEARTHVEPASASHDSGPDSTAGPSPARLWWEDDPQLAERFHPR
jgi:cytochrome c oxidase assembly factor CtaG